MLFCFFNHLYLIIASNLFLSYCFLTHESRLMLKRLMRYLRTLHRCLNYNHAHVSIHRQCRQQLYQICYVIFKRQNALYKFIAAVGIGNMKGFGIVHNPNTTSNFVFKGIFFFSFSFSCLCFAEAIENMTVVLDL